MKLFVRSLLAAAVVAGLSVTAVVPAHAATVTLPAGCTSDELASAKSNADIQNMECAGLPATADLTKYSFMSHLTLRGKGGAKSLPKLPASLYFLHTVAAEELNDFSGLSRTPDLVYLTVTGRGVKDFGPIVRSPKIARLVLIGDYWGADLSALSSMKSLKHLEVRSVTSRPVTIGESVPADFPKGLDGKVLIPTTRDSKTPAFQYDAKSGTYKYPDAGQWSGFWEDIHVTAVPAEVKAKMPGLSMTVDMKRAAHIYLISEWSKNPGTTMKITGTKAVGGTIKIADHPYVDEIQWLRDGQPIPGASTSRWDSYKLTAADAGRRISVRGIDNRWTTEPNGNGRGYFVRQYSQVALVSASVPVQFEKASVTVSGTQKTGAVLTAKATSTPAATSVTYQWYRAGAAISGATGSTYTVRALDGTQPLSVAVTARKAGYLNLSATGKAVVSATQKNLARPSINFEGDWSKLGGWDKYAADRQGFTAGNGSWAVKPDSYRYQWYVDGNAIPGATGKSYAMKPQFGSRVWVKVSAVRLGTTTVSSKSQIVAHVGSGYWSFSG